MFGCIYISAPCIYKPGNTRVWKACNWCESFLMLWVLNTFLAIFGCFLLFACSPLPRYENDSTSSRVWPFRARLLCLDCKDPLPAFSCNHHGVPRSESLFHACVYTCRLSLHVLRSCMQPIDQHQLSKHCCMSLCLSFPCAGVCMD